MGVAEAHTHFGVILSDQEPSNQRPFRLLQFVLATVLKMMNVQKARKSFDINAYIDLSCPMVMTIFGPAIIDRVAHSTAALLCATGLVDGAVVASSFAR